MESETIRVFAHDMLNLSITDVDTAKLAQTLAGLREIVQIIEGVPLPFLEDPFMTPAVGDAWLDSWPAEGELK